MYLNYNDSKGELVGERANQKETQKGEQSY